MKQNKFKSDRETKSIIKSFRVTPSQEEEINKNSRTLNELVDLALYLTKDEDFSLILKKSKLESKAEFMKNRIFNLENEIEKMRNALISIELDIKEIDENLKDKNFDIINFTKEKDIKNSIQTTLDYYHKYYNPKSKKDLSFDLFLLTHKSYIKKQATRCKLNENEFKERLILEFNQIKNQEILV